MTDTLLRWRVDRQQRVARERWITPCEQCYEEFGRFEIRGRDHSYRLGSSCMRITVRCALLGMRRP